MGRDRGELAPVQQSRRGDVATSSSTPNGTGPFALERWDRTAKYVLLTRNDRYWRKPAALKRVLIKTVPEFATRRLMLQAGDADVI